MQHATEGAHRAEWLKIDSILTAWLKERQKLWLLYTQISDNTSVLKTFCQILVDYIAAGHFEVFEKLALASEICTPTHPALNEIVLENISKTTLLALNFNDKYNQDDNQSQDSQTLIHDLSQLGEHLANRIDWEDQLLQTYFKATEAYQ